MGIPGNRCGLDVRGIDLVPRESLDGISPGTEHVVILFYSVLLGAIKRSMQR